MRKITKNPTNNLTEKKRQSYAEALFGNIKKILKIKDNYSNLLSKKIENIHNVISSIVKPKPCINITTKSPLHKQIIALMSSKNISKFMALYRQSYHQLELCSPGYQI